MKDKYAIYLRKSRADLDLESIDKLDTLKRHEDILTELAKRNHYPIGEIYKEVVSGETIDARPEVQRLLSDIKVGKWKGVLVVEVERLARGDTKDQGIIAETFKFTNTLIITPSKIYDPNNQFDEEYFEFGLFMSRREYKTIQRRLTAGKLQSIKEGNYLPPAQPYGWNIVRKGKTRTLVPHEQESKIVKLIYDWRIHENLTTHKIAVRLTEMGVPTYTGAKEWNKASIRDILLNPVHAGKIRWNATKVTRVFDDDGRMQKVKKRTAPDEVMLIDGKHTGIIPFEEWQKVQKAFKQDKTKANKELLNPLSTILVCAKCGRTMVLRRYPCRGNTRARLMHAQSSLCNVKSVLYDDAEAAIIQALAAHVVDFEIKMNNANEIATLKRHNEQIMIMEKEIEGYAAQRKKLFDLLERGIYDEEDFVERKALLDAKKRTAKKQLEELKATSLQPIDYKEKIIKLTDAINALKNEKVSAKAKNRFLKEIVDRIEFSRENNDSFILDVHLL